MRHELPTLEYALDAFSPVISKQTMELHWEKHVQAYINNLNNLIAGTKFENASLDRIIKESEGALYNNAGQVWNHMFYFEALSPQPRKIPEGRLSDAINKQFGSLETFKEYFNKSAIGLFGSGWTWLVRQENGALLITQEQNAGNPLHSKTGTPLLCADMWEHAYYMDYQNRRADYLNAFWEVLDWSVVEKWF
ncbi:MAG: superoxide dismutase [Prevotellaceae bacterium]|jgi:Fe-Mn family superoxide dismutase|nr:superoxide dismutase [Prevotellaceae bacterium]